LGASKQGLVVVMMVGLVFGHDWDQTPEDFGVTLVASHVHQEAGPAGVVGGRQINFYTTLAGVSRFLTGQSAAGGPAIS
jgi:hypothetical protein